MVNKYFLLALFACFVIGCNSALAPGAVCTADDQCGKYYLCEDSVCTHKDLFPNTTSEELGGVFVAIIANSISNTGGIGAGGLLVPYLNLMNNLSPNAGIVVTYAIVFGGGIGAVLGVIFKKNPVTGGPLIVYNIDILCIPCLLGGVPIGILLNKILAPIVVTVLLFCLLLFSIIKIGQRFRETFKKERQLAKEAKALKEAQEQPIPLGTEAQGQLREESTPVEDENRVTEQDNPVEGAPNDQLEVEMKKSNKPEELNSEKDLIVTTEPGTHHHQHHHHENQHHQLNMIHTEEPQGRKSHRVFVHPKHGDVVDVEDELYELGMNSVLFMALPDPQKIVDENREIERRHSLERRLSLERRPSLELQEKVKSQKADTEVTLPQISEAEKQLAEKIRKRELRRFPLEKVGILFLSLALYVIFNIIMGTSKFESVTGNIGYCSGGYWALWVILILLEIGIYIFAVFLVLKGQRQKESIGWDFRPEDLKLNRKRAIVIFLVSFLGGTLGGVLALGGGLIIAPFFLEFAVPPQPLAASAAVFIIFTQFSTLIIAILTGSYAAKDFIFLLCISAVFSYMFSRGVNWFVHKTKKQSLILGILVIILVIAFIANLAAMSINLRDNKDFMVSFVSYC